MDQRADAGDEQDPGDRQRVGEEADVDVRAVPAGSQVKRCDDVARAPRAGRSSIAKNITTDHDEREHHQRGGDPAGDRARRCACRRAAGPPRRTAAARARSRSGRGDRARSRGWPASALQEIEVVGGGAAAAPEDGDDDARGRPRPRRRRPTSTKNTITWPRMSFSALANDDEREVHRVEHELDAHEHHEHVAPDEQADRADGEEHRREHEVVGRR